MAELHRFIELKEFELRRLPKSALKDSEAEQLWKDYRDQVAVELPSFKNEYEWALTAQGWVGHIPVSPGLTISLAPKVPIANLFRMLEYAYDIEIRNPQGLVDAKTLSELYERIASILAKRVLDRARRGLYRTYVQEADSLPYIRGSLDLSRRFRRPWEVLLPCEYQENTADVEENQILAWTLLRISRSGACTERVFPTLRSAYRAIQGAVALQPFAPSECVGRLYDRLNADYRPLHALCRFFLEHSGPTHLRGNREMIPFLVNMSRLFERFVAKWLEKHLPPRFRLEIQETVKIDELHHLRFDIDLVVYDLESTQILTIIDTKYKKATTPSSDDVQQVVAYAVSKHCQRAMLVYPVEVPLKSNVGEVSVESSAFSLDGDLEESGKLFLKKLLEPYEFRDAGQPIAFSGSPATIA